MAHRLKRARFARIAVGMAVLAFPLLAVGTAQAAIAGANPESTSNRPDLVSATALDATNVDICFDRQLTNGAFTAANFSIGGYRAARTVSPTTVLLEQTFNTTGTCVRATFPSTIGDIGQYTIATVKPGAVSTFGGVTQPAGISDSTSLTVPAALSPTHNGTTGFTVTPDLVGVLADPTTNTITYTEDQAVGNVPTASNFKFTRSGGTQCTGTGTPVVSGNQVTVLFGPVATCPTSDAVRAGYTGGAGGPTAAADPGIPSTPDNAIVPASPTVPGTGTTAVPDVVSATEEPGGGAIDYVFDKSVGVTAAGQNKFHVILSNGLSVASSSASVIAISGTSTTVRVTFTAGGATDLSQFVEYAVKAEVDAGAVTESSPPNNPNVFDARPTGDNAGAFARGFTTAADVFNATISVGTGVVTLGLDQRIFSDVPANIMLLDATGFPVATAAAGSVTFPSQAAGPEQITVQFSPGQASTAKNVSVGAGALTTVTPVSQANVPQVLSAVLTASTLRSARVHHAVSKKQTAARKRHVRAVEKALLAKFLRQLHHKHHHA